MCRTNYFVTMIVQDMYELDVSCRVVEVCVALTFFIQFGSSTNYGSVQTFKPAQDLMVIDIV